MSRAFVREDVDLPEPSGRKRAASGLPPGAVNYITSRGAARLQRELTRLRQVGADDRVADLERILSSVQIVEPMEASAKGAAFGATVTLSDTAGRTETRTIVGVDELDLEPDAVSWISPLGRRLLATKLGDRITLEDGRNAKIVKVEYRQHSLQVAARCLVPCRSREKTERSLIKTV
jgi:transcription elongation GreA/GreB family factor